MDRTQFSRYLTGKHPISEKFITKICEYFPEINPVWLLYGEGNIHRAIDNINKTNININRAGDVYGNTNSNASIGRVPMKTTKQQNTPYFNAETAACGAFSGFGEALSANTAYDCIVIPTLPTMNGDVFLQTRGRSMIDAKCPERSIPEGAMVLVRKWNRSFVEWGEIYCIVTTDGYIVKKLMPGSSENRIKCVSADSENFPPYEISADEIKDIGRVIAVVSTKLI